MLQLNIFNFSKIITMYIVGQNTEIFSIKGGCTLSNHFALKVKIDLKVRDSGSLVQ
jgi:hypothetical protein